MNRGFYLLRDTDLYRNYRLSYYMKKFGNLDYNVPFCINGIRITRTSINNNILFSIEDRRFEESEIDPKSPKEVSLEEQFKEDEMASFRRTLSEEEFKKKLIYTLETFNEKDSLNFDRFLAISMFFDEHMEVEGDFYGIKVEKFLKDGVEMYRIPSIFENPLSEEELEVVFMSHLNSLDDKSLNEYDKEMENTLDKYIEEELSNVPFYASTLSSKRTLKTHFVSNFKKDGEEKKFLIVPSFLNVESLFGEDETRKDKKHLNVSCLVFELENDNFKYISHEDGSSGIIVDVLTFEELEYFLRSQQMEYEQENIEQDIKLEENPDALEMLFRAMSKNRGNTTEEFVPIVFVDDEGEKNIIISFDEDKIILDDSDGTHIESRNILEFIREASLPESAISKTLSQKQYGIPVNLDENYRQIREYAHNLIKEQLQQNIMESAGFLMSSNLNYFKEFEREYILYLGKVAAKEYAFPPMITNKLSQEDNNKYQNFIALYNFLTVLNKENLNKENLNKENLNNKVNANLVSDFNKIIDLFISSSKSLESSNLTKESIEKQRLEILDKIKELYDNMNKGMAVKNPGLSEYFVFNEELYNQTKITSLSKLKENLASQEIDQSLILSFIDDFYKQTMKQCILLGLRQAKDKNNLDINLEEIQKMSFEDISMFLFEGVYSRRDLDIDAYLKAIPNSNGKIDLEEITKRFSINMISYTFNTESFINTKEFKIDCLNKNIMSSDKNLIKSLEENFDKNRKNNHQELCMIREYIKSGIEFPGTSDTLSQIQGEYNALKRIYGVDYSDKWIDAYLQSMSNKELERLYFDNKKNLNDFYQAISVSFEDVLDNKINSLNEDNNCFSIKCDGFTFNIRYLEENLYEFSITKMKNGITETTLIDNLTKEKVLLCLLAKDILREDEKESFRQENIQAYLSRNLSKVYASRFGTEGIDDILEKNIPLEEKVLRTLYNEKTFVLTNNYYTDRRNMIVLDKVGEDFYIKTFTLSNVTTKVEDIVDVSLNKGNCTHIRKGVDEYKLSNGKGYLQVETKKIDVDQIKVILSGITSSEWTPSISDTLTISPPSTESYFTDRSKEDNSCLNTYILEKSLSMDDKIVRFLNQKVVGNLKSEEKNIDIKKASYVFDVQGRDGSINKFIVNFSAGRDTSFIDMDISIVHRNPSGKVISIENSSIKDALVFKNDLLTISKESKQEEFIGMVLGNMLKNQDQLKGLKKIVENPIFQDSEHPKLSNINVFQEIIQEYRKLYQKYMHCKDEFDAFEERINASKDISGEFSKEDFPQIYKTLRLEIADELQKSLKERIEENFPENIDDKGNIIPLESSQIKSLELEVYKEKVREIEYFINIHKIITSSKSNEETMNQLLSYEAKTKHTISKITEKEKDKEKDKESVNFEVEGKAREADTSSFER